MAMIRYGVCVRSDANTSHCLTCNAFEKVVLVPVTITEPMVSDTVPASTCSCQTPWSAGTIFPRATLTASSGMGLLPGWREHGHPIQHYLPEPAVIFCQIIDVGLRTVIRGTAIARETIGHGWTTGLERKCHCGKLRVYAVRRVGSGCVGDERKRVG